MRINIWPRKKKIGWNATLSQSLSLSSSSISCRKPVQNKNYHFDTSHITNCFTHQMKSAQEKGCWMIRQDGRKPNLLGWRFFTYFNWMHHAPKYVVEWIFFVKKIVHFHHASIFSVTRRWHCKYYCHQSPPHNRVHMLVGRLNTNVCIFFIFFHSTVTVTDQFDFLPFSTRTPKTARANFHLDSAIHCRFRTRRARKAPKGGKSIVFYLWHHVSCSTIPPGIVECIYKIYFLIIIFLNKTIMEFGEHS